MKTKILLSSNSGLDYLNNDLDIRSIPDRINVSGKEIYNDYEDIKLDNLYMRLRYTNESLKVSIPDYEIIKKKIEEDINNSYERFVYLVDKNNNDYYELVRKIKADMNLDMDILRVNKASYILSELAIQIDELYKKNISLVKINEFIEEFNRNRLFICNPTFDKYIDFSNNTEEDFNDLKSSIIYEYKNNLSQIKWNKKDNPLSYMIKNILHDIENKQFKLFLLYTYKDSNYISFLIKKIKDYYPNLNIILLPMPVELSSISGPYSFGIGYVIDMMTTQEKV